jgi:hypothetical protein
MHSARLNYYKINKSETRLLYITFLLKLADVINRLLMGLINRLTGSIGLTAQYVPV